MICLSYLKPYTFHIDLYDLAFLGVIFVGITFALLLWFTKSVSKAANRFLAMALGVVVFQIAGILGTDIRLETYISNWNLLPMQFSLALGPLIFFYVLKITRPEYKFRLTDLLHSTPLALQLGAHAFQQFNLVLQLLVFISVVIYLYKSHRLIEQFYQNLRFNAGDR